MEVVAMSTLTSFPRGVFVGAVLMYFLDPRRGRARRSRVVDLLTHLRRDERRLLDKGARDARHRVQGVLERIQKPQSTQEASDDIIEARVHARLGRIVSSSRVIEVIVEDGSVTLRGPVVEDEAEPVLREVRRIPGVRGVVDLLERHASRDVPSLQRNPPRPTGELWPPWARVTAQVAGGTLVAWGLLGRRGIAGAITAASGGALLLRGLLDMPTSRMLGFALGREQIEVHKTLTVRASIDRVFELWRHFENFPRFMNHIQRVEIDPQDPMRSRWTVDGPAGRPVSFEAMITRIDGNREIAWRTVPQQSIEHGGRVRFTPVLEGTRIEVHMSYRPLGGALGHAIARLLGFDPKARIDDDMVRMKALLQDGQTRAHGERVAIRDLLH
jgi:uncharacterized membrane protein